MCCSASCIKTGSYSIVGGGWKKHEKGGKGKWREGSGMQRGEGGDGKRVYLQVENLMRDKVMSI